jgi:hypothetical protein
VIGTDCLAADGAEIHLGAMKKIALLCLTALPALGQSFTSLAQQQASFREGCGPADPAYIRTANETGGIPMFLQRSEAAKAFHLVRESTRNNVSTVLWAAGSLETQAQVFEVPVDSLTQRITFTFSFDTEGNNVTIIAPSRGTIRQNSGDTEITELRCGRIVTVASPDAGNWHVELTGKGRFWVEAQAQSDIHFVGVEFVRTGGRPGHEGWFRIDGQPVAGRPATIRASLSSAGARKVEFYLAGERGETIRTLRLQPLSSEEFLGTADLPDMPFRIAVRGLDSNGRQYQRFFAQLFHAESVEVSWSPAYDELPAGSEQQAEFTVRNTGYPRTFKLTVTDARKFVSKFEPKELTLGQGQSGTIRVGLTVPSGTSQGVGDDVVVVATSTAGPFTSNSAVAHFSVTVPATNSNR